MHLVANCVEELPPLAWSALLPKGGTAIDLYHGRNVEVLPAGFFEGAWAGDFAKATFDRATNVFGSGGALLQDKVVFVGPSHTLEPLYIAQTNELSAVSNSLTFLLYRTGLQLDLGNSRYGRAFSEIVHGLEHTPQVIELKGGNLTLLYHHNAVLTSDGTIDVTPKPLPPNFADFDDYRSYLLSVTSEVFQNANETARRFRYRPISTISSGYDSAASSVIAKSCGCSESLSLSTSNTGTPDSGRATAEVLGLQHTDFKRMASASSNPMLEAEFLASGMQGEDLVYAVFEERICGRLLATGFQGGKIWSRTDPPNSHIKRADLSGCSLGEFRLRANFLHVPIPFIGIQRHHDIYRISNAPDMEPYLVGRAYDRPLPRRILEEAGVERSLFGRRKMGASILLFQGRNRLSRAARASIEDFCRQQREYPRYAQLLQAKTLWWTLGRNLYRVARKLGKILGVDRSGWLSRTLAWLCTRLFGIEAPVFGASHPRFTSLLVWAISKVEGRYAAIARRASSSRMSEIASSLICVFLVAPGVSG